MGRRGPPKKPPALEDLQGRPSHRPRNESEPKPDAIASLAPPPWLDRPAREFWRAHAPELARLGLLNVLNAHVFGAGCRWWAIWRYADGALKSRAASRKQDLTDETKANGRQAVAELGIAKTAFEQATKILARFGFTPADMAGLQAPQPKGVTDGAGSGPEAGPPKDPHDQLAERRRQRAAQRGLAG